MQACIVDDDIDMAQTRVNIGHGVGDGAVVADIHHHEYHGQ